MKKLSSWTICIPCACTVLLCFSACSDGGSPKDAIDEVLNLIDDSSISNVATANTSFGFKLLKDLQKRQPDSNIMISPLSISIALTMTYNGAVGQTQRAMAEVLDIEGLGIDTVNRSNAALRNSLENTDPKVEIAIANSIWSSQGVDFNPGFLDRNREFFEAEIGALNFNDPQATEIINGWVDTNTNGKINQIVQQIDPATLIFLINAIYFKGSWQKEFDKSATRDGIFHLSDGGQKRVKLMYRKGAYSHLRGENFEAARLPYGEGRVSMYIFLPDRDSNPNDVIEQLNAENWSHWLSQFQDRTDNSEMILPRFKLEYEVRLNEALTALGMGIAFVAGADFSGMGTQLFISEVRHKTIIEVNEEGTEAAAVTAVVGVKSLPPAFRVDRPFIFAIHDDRTETILFLGIVVEPV
ncbi:MAG: serpin family protein [Candidatus Poribacteria bacterium]|nr:serpin family protein [Candidatus Poribacteria bacterium]MDE0505400.1 serpin family protein [Candidatus Poribacteria bacterium]